MYIGLLGRLPTLSRAEIESLTGPALAQKERLLSLNSQPPVERLGGLVKLCFVIKETSNWAQDLKRAVTDFSQNGGKKLGVSSYSSISGQKLKKTLMQIKRNHPSRLRLILPQQKTLSSAQILHHKLLSNNQELCLMQLDRLYLARTVWEQDIVAYRQRDYGRPARDPITGMLPPKLAQIMINLATKGQMGRLLDPCCGTGVVLQEAQRMGYEVFGADISPKMIAASKQNLGQVPLMVADARQATYQETDFIVSETDLGPALKKPLSVLESQKIEASFKGLHTKILANIARQLKSGGRLCLALPKWHLKDGRWRHLSFNLPSSLKTVAELDYNRPGQIVGRKLLVAIKR